MRKGMGKGTGKGYKNIIGIDSRIHSMSSKGIKQPQKINPIMINTLNSGKVPKDKAKAMERLIFLVRANKDEKTPEGWASIRLGFQEVAKELDRLGVPMWKQNYISMLAEENNWYMDKIINKVYFLEKPTDFKRDEKKLNQEPLEEKPFKDYYRDLREDAEKLDRSDLQGVVMVKSKEIMKKFKIPDDKYDEVENILLLYADGEENINSVQRYLLDLIPITEAREVYK